MDRALYKNSFYLMINTGVLAISGFVFWLLVARVYTPHEIGIATTLFSAILMISGISIFGLNAGLLRYIPKSKSFHKRFNSSIILVSVWGSILSGIYLAILPLISHDLTFIRSNSFFIVSFILFTIISTISELLESVFLALKKTPYILQKNGIFSILKLVLPFLFISLGAYGIISSIFISSAFAVFIGFILLYKETSYRFHPQFSAKDISDMATYSFGSFISAQMSNLPLYLLPIIITAKLSVIQTAYYFIAASIASFLYVIPKIVTQNLLVEGSHDEKNVKSHILHSGIIIFSLFIPLAFGIIFFGQYILSLFGKNYSQEGFMLLRLLTVSSFFACFNAVFGTIYAIKKQVKLLILANTTYSAILLLYAFYFLPNGLITIGYASIIAQIVVLIVNSGIITYKKYYV